MTWEKKPKVNPEDESEVQRFVKTETNVIDEVSLEDLEARKASFQNKITALEAKIAAIDADIAAVQGL